MAPFLTLLIVAASFYPLSSGELPWTGWRGASESRRWIFIGDDQVMLEPVESAAVDFSGFGEHGGGDDGGQWRQSSGENWEDLEQGEWDGGGMVLG